MIIFLINNEWKELIISLEILPYSTICFWGVSGRSSGLFDSSHASLADLLGLYRHEHADLGRRATVRKMMDVLDHHQCRWDEEGYGGMRKGTVEVEVGVLLFTVSFRIEMKRDPGCITITRRLLQVLVVVVVEVMLTLGAKGKPTWKVANPIVARVDAVVAVVLLGTSGWSHWLRQSPDILDAPGIARTSTSSQVWYILAVSWVPVDKKQTPLLQIRIIRNKSWSRKPIPTVGSWRSRYWIFEMIDFCEDPS